MQSKDTPISSLRPLKVYKICFLEYLIVMRILINP